MKPPTKDWSWEHQSPSCKSSPFQTSGVLIQPPPRGELLVRNQYSSWRYSDPPSTKTREVWKISPRERVEKFIRSILCRPARWASNATVQSSKRVHRPKVTFKDTSTRVRAAFTSEKKKINQEPESNSMFPIGVRVVNGNMINITQTATSLHRTHHRPCSPSPLPCHSVEYFGSSSTAASGCVAVLVSPPTSFFWPWRISAPELESTLSTPSCDIRPSSFSCRECSETNKKSPVGSKSISQILRCRPHYRFTGQHQNPAAVVTQRGNLSRTQR